MGKKKEKDTESKKANDKGSKGGSLIDSLLPTKGKPENRGTGNTVGGKNTPAGKTAKAVAGGMIAVAIGGLALVGFNLSSNSHEGSVKHAAPAAVTRHQPARATSEAAAASMIPQPLAPQKTQLAELAKNNHELAKPSKERGKKATKVAGKAKDSKKKVVASNQKNKAVKHDKKSKKALAAKSLD